MPGVIIILHLRTTNDNHDVWFLIYQAEYITTDRICCHFGLFFALLAPYQSRKSKFCKTEKSSQRYYHLHKRTPNDNHMIWLLRYQLQQIFFVIFGHFLPFYSPNSPKNENIKTMKKTTRDIIILHQCTKDQDHSLCCS